MAKYVYPTGEEQVARHLGGVVLTAEEKERLRQSLEPVAITDKERSFYSCCRQYGPPCQAKHREYGTCPHCGTKVYNILRRWIKKDERREQFHYFYSRSKTDKDTIIIRGVWVAEIWEDAKYIDTDEVKTRTLCHSLLVIPYGGKPARYIWEGGYREGWEKRKDPQGNKQTAWLARTGAIKTVIDAEEQEKVIRGTRFEKMVTWAANHNGIYYARYLASILINIAMHPQLEYLAARGLNTLCKETFNGNTMHAINWKAKTPEKMLGLTQNEMGRIKAKGLEIDSKTLVVLKQMRRVDKKTKLEDVMVAAHNIPAYQINTVTKIIAQYGARFGGMKILRYASRNTMGYNIGTWEDYLRELKELGEAADEARVFPRDLLAAHAETSARIKIKADEAQQKKLDGLLPELRKKYSFRAGGLVLEPFWTVAEVIEEGAKQHICIASYAERYAKGGTVLCKLRRESTPETPWHAVEFDTRGRMIQCRGERNTTAPEDEQTVRDFWAAWDAAKKTTTNVQLTIRARRTAA